MLINHNYIQDDINSKLNLGNACYRSAEIVLSSRLLPEPNIQKYNSSVISYGNETLSFTLKKETFGPKRKEVTRRTKKPQCAFFAKFDKGDETKDEMGQACSMHGEIINGKILGRPWRTCEHNIKIDLREIGGEGVGLINLQYKIQWRDLVNALMTFPDVGRVKK
jgi:hypothetical protein